MTATAPTTTGSLGVDPFADAPPAPRWRYLQHVNPLAKLAAPIVPVIVLLFVNRPIAPALLIALVYLLLLSGARMTRLLGILLAVFPVVIAVLAVGLSLWVDPATLAHPGRAVLTTGGWSLTEGALQSGLTSSLRINAMILLGIFAGITSNGPDLVRSAVQHLRLPYRIGYTALAAYRFVPRFRHELGVIRAAHRVRGHHAGHGPFAAIARWWGYILPLMAGAIRHAERVALAMDSRAFGAHATRTERHQVPWRWTDWLFLGLFLAACAGIFAVSAAVS